MMSDEGFDAKVAALAALLRSSERCVVFTGAGVSTLSGIPDFRGKNGLYRSVDADRMFDLEVFRRDPSVYYSMARDLFYGRDDRRPSAWHLLLARMERVGIVKAVITQNVDLLHRRAGSRVVYEIHGSPDGHRCPACGFTETFDAVAALVREGKLPRCPECGLALKPDIVFFGEALPRDALDAAIDAVRQADLMLVLGSSLVVEPAASIPRLALESGAAIVIVNDGATYLDARARLRFDDLASVAMVLDRLVSP